MKKREITVKELMELDKEFQFSTKINKLKDLRSIVSQFSPEYYAVDDEIVKLQRLFQEKINELKFV